jgi:hypothetical protein
MMKSRATVLLPVFALALASPAWAVAPSDDVKPDSTTAARANQMRQPAAQAQSSDAANSGANKTKKDAQPHGPTAIMDRATPTEKSSTSPAQSDKHPPTGRMDRVTPDQKSPTSAPSDATKPTSQ